MPDLKKLHGPSRLVAALLVAASLAGCNTVVLNPAGDVAAQSGNLVIIATLLMLIIIVPVIVLILLFAFKYRESNEPADYDPEWHHSTVLELVIWSVPLLIIIALGALTWIYTHKLDPYRPLDRIDANRPLAADVKPLEVEVVAMDWKWLFIYPEQGIATINELAAPVDRPIRFKLTATTTMNAFYVPDLAGKSHAIDADTAVRRDQQAWRVQGHELALQRLGLCRHDLQVPRPEQWRLRRLGAKGQDRRRHLGPCGIREAGKAERARSGPPVQHR
jgi:cytochrome o ubiquinol oxidase subunit 2